MPRSSTLPHAATALLVLACACRSEEPPASPPTTTPAPTEAPKDPAAPQAPACPDDPVAQVRAAYAVYDDSDALTPDLAHAACWTTAMAARIAADEAAAVEGVPALGFDPLIDAQDFRILDLKVRALDEDTVEATFVNFDRPTRITWEFEREGGRWRVRDLRGERWGLWEGLHP